MADLFLPCPVPRRHGVIIILSTPVITVTQVNSTNNAPGTRLSELIPNNPLTYIFYYYLHFKNEKN